MTTLSQTAGQPASRNESAGFFRVLGGWVNGIVTYFAHREAIKTLSELDDRALRDIGIERSRIESAVRGVVDPKFGRIRRSDSQLPLGGPSLPRQCRTTSTEQLA